jgi:hypothetical protein
MKDFAQAIRDAIQSTGRTALQNILMRIPDKVCAAALGLVSEKERGPVYALIAESKAERIREEIRLGARRRVTPAVRTRLIQSFLSYFRSGRTRDPRVWIRPIRPDGEGKPPRRGGLSLR